MSETATAAPAPDPEPSGPRQRGSLEALVKRVTDAYVTGELALADGEALTPHRIAKFIEAENVSGRVSAGAVTAMLTRWQTVGFVVLSSGPLAFQEYTTDAVTMGLKQLKAQHRQEQKDARKAAKQAAVVA